MEVDQYRLHSCAMKIKQLFVSENSNEGNYPVFC